MMKQLAVAVAVLGLASQGMAAMPKTILVNAVQPKNMPAEAAQAVDMAICNTTQADKRFDVTCAEDMKHVMDVDGQLGMLGASPKCEGGDCNERIAKRMKTEATLGGSVAKLAENKYVLTIILTHNETGKELGRVEEQVAGGQAELFDRARGGVKKLLGQLK